MKKWFGFLFAICVTPVFLYVHKFGFGLWEKNEDWAYLGSFFGGVLGPAFTLMSVVLLVLTLKETQQANYAQLELAKKQYFDNYFFNSMTALTHSLENQKYGLKHDTGEVYENFFSEATAWVVNNFMTHSNTDLNGDAWEIAKSYIRQHRGIFDSEAALLIPLLSKIKDMPQDQQSHYLTLIEGLIDNDMRFWLEVYGLVWSVGLRFTLQGVRFSNLPQVIQNKINELESMS